MAGTDIIKAEQYAVVKQDGDELLATLDANLGGQKIGEFDLDRVQMPSGGGAAWTVPSLEGEDMVKELAGVIIAWKDTRVYWQKSFEEQGGGNPPDCSAPDALHGVGDRGIDGDNPQSRHDCELCPLSQYGSDPRPDSNAQACKQVRVLFLLTPDDLLPLVIPLPPTSVGIAQKFFLRLSQKGIPYYGVVSKISLTKEKSGGGIAYSRASFAVAERLDNEAAAKIKDYADKLRPSLESVAINDATDIGVASAA